MFTSRDEIARSLIDAGISQAMATKLAALAKPCLALETQSCDETDIPIGATKFGGNPDVPPDFDWPVRPGYSHAAEELAKRKKQISEIREQSAQARDEGEEDVMTDEDIDALATSLLSDVERQGQPAPLSFIAQFDLTAITSESADNLDLPTQGRLLLFYDAVTQPWGFQPGDTMGTRLIWDRTPIARLSRIPPPAGAQVFNPITCKLQPCMSPVAVDDFCFPDLPRGEPDRFKYESWWDRISSTQPYGQHQVRGNAQPIQNEMQSECQLVSGGDDVGNGQADRATEAEQMLAEAKDWQLLLQIGTDDDAGMMWGDTGTLYVWIWENDLRAGRFDRANLILQCS